MESMKGENNTDVDLKESLRDAQLLLSYIVTSNLEIDKKSAEAVAEMRENLKEGRFSKEAEVEFWLALDNIARNALPVTVASLKCAHDEYGGKSVFRFWDRRPVSLARKAIIRFRLISLVALILVVAFQIYWSIGATIIANIDDFSTSVEKLEIEKNQVKQKTINQSGQNTASDSFEVNSLDAKIENYDSRIEMSNQMLETWNNAWKLKFLFSTGNAGPNSPLPTAEDDAIDPGQPSTIGEIKIHRLNNQHTAQFVLQAMQLYLLPLLYGWLGACTYVLRMLLEEIKRMTYSCESGIMFSLRIFLGALAGLAVGWFLKPEMNEAFLETISPFALAFLAGYSVELLFSAMDRIIAAFSQQAAVKG